MAVTDWTEAAKVDLLTEDGWVDITGLTGRVELEPEGVGDGVFLPVECEVEVTFRDLRAFVEVSDGKVIKIKPRLET